MPANSTITSNVIGTNAGREFHGLPPTLMGQSEAVVQYSNHTLKDAPNRRPTEQHPGTNGTVISMPRLGGLHHRYAWRPSGSVGDERGFQGELGTWLSSHRAPSLLPKSLAARFVARICPTYSGESDANQHCVDAFVDAFKDPCVPGGPFN